MDEWCVNGCVVEGWLGWVGGWRMDGWLNMSKREMDAQRCRCIKDIGMHRCVDGREEEGVVGCIWEHKDE